MFTVRLGEKQMQVLTRFLQVGDQIQACVGMDGIRRRRGRAHRRGRWTCRAGEPYAPSRPMRSRGAHLRRVTAGRRAVGDGPHAREDPPSRKERSRKLVNVNMFSAPPNIVGAGSQPPLMM